MGDYPVAERAFHVVKRFDADGAVTLCAQDRATLSTYPAPSRELAYAMADSLNSVVAFHVAMATASTTEWTDGPPFNDAGDRYAALSASTETSEPPSEPCVQEDHQ